MKNKNPRKRKALPSKFLLQEGDVVIENLKKDVQKEKIITPRKKIERRNGPENRVEEIIVPKKMVEKRIVPEKKVEKIQPVQ